MNLKVIIAIILILPNICFGATKYVDMVAGACVGNYSIASRNCSGVDGTSYATIATAIAAVSVGDVIYIRGGNYTEDITLPNVNGTAWTVGNYITVASYTGEWAIITGTSQTSKVFSRVGNPSGAPPDVPTSYWLFERLELTGGRFAFLLDKGPIWIRYCYIHDNNYSGNCDDLASGIWINQSRLSIIEYNYIANNIADGVKTGNCSNIALNADYYDDSDPTTFIEDDALSRNVIRYNYIVGSRSAIHYKNQQRFGTNTRTSAGVISSYGTWGDLIHHNIVENPAQYGIVCDQDNCQVYNNIINGSSEYALGVQFGLEESLSSSVPRILNTVSYNNTVIKSLKAFGNSSGCDAGTDTCVDEGGVGAVPVPYTWHYNNISDQNHTTGWQQFPFVIAAELAVGRVTTMTNVYIKNNLVHSPVWDGGLDNDYILRGRASGYTIAEAEVAFPSIANNYTNSTANLFHGVTGADQYKTVGTFVIGASTIATGGIGGAHPYLAGVTIPSYVGAVNPSSTCWVNGVLGLNSSYFTSATAGSTPNWIDGGSECGSSITLGAGPLTITKGAGSLTLSW